MSDFKCDHCICKTCLIAEVNGGAPGCGDCYRCMSDKENDHPGQCTNCSDYYNTDTAKGMSLHYLFSKMAEDNNKLEEEYWVELGKAMAEDIDKNFVDVKEVANGNNSSRE